MDKVMRLMMKLARTEWGLGLMWAFFVAGSMLSPSNEVGAIFTLLSFPTGVMLGAAIAADVFLKDLDKDRIE